MRVGVAAYLQKPVDEQALLQAIERAGAGGVGAVVRAQSIVLFYEFFPARVGAAYAL
jgi:DNA-binding NarL/FixJ family response regulator